jgi:hypothetical protein
MAVLHGIEEKLLDHEVGLEAGIARKVRSATKVLDETPGVLPGLQPGGKHTHSRCDGVHRIPALNRAL